MEALGYAQDVLFFFFFPDNEINQIGVWFSLKTRVAHVIFISLSNKQKKIVKTAGKYNSVKAVL